MIPQSHTRRASYDTMQWTAKLFKRMASSWQQQNCRRQSWRVPDVTRETTVYDLLPWRHHFIFITGTSTTFTNLYANKSQGGQTNLVPTATTLQTLILPSHQQRIRLSSTCRDPQRITPGSELFHCGRTLGGLEPGYSKKQRYQRTIKY